MDKKSEKLGGKIMFGDTSIDLWWAALGIVMLIGFLVLNGMAAHDAKKAISTDAGGKGDTAPRW